MLRCENDAMPQALGGPGPRGPVPGLRPCPSGLVQLADQRGHADGDTGSSREAVVKALRVLRDRHWIATGRRTIRTLDRDALQRR